MVIELLLSPIFLLVGGVIDLLPTIQSIPVWVSDTVSLLSKALAFFPGDVWYYTIGNIIFWLSVQFAWSIIEWVYRKIPGVD